MDFKLILLILSVIIISFVFYFQFKEGCGKREGLETGDKSKQDQEYCENEYTQPTNLPLREYYIKSSFNTAYDGNDVSCSTIIARLAEGYRFIDFNVFSASGDVFVGFSQGNTPTLDSGKLRFSEALECIAKNAFTAQQNKDTPPNQVTWDYTSLPVFVNIRVFRAAGSTVDIISNVANIINPNSGSTTAGKVSPPSYSTFYHMDSATNMPKKVHSCTTLSDLSKKIIFTMNIENVLEVYTPSAEYASQIPEGTIAALNTYVNFLTGGHTCPAYYNYTDAIQSLTSRTNVLMRNKDDISSYQTNIRHMIIVFPHPKDEDVQPDVKQFALNCSALILPMRVYLGDDSSSNLKLNTCIFDKGKTAFVPAVNLQGIINNYDQK